MYNAVGEHKVSFIENLAHDLKTPVYSQINALNLLLNDKDFRINDVQRELLASLLASNLYMKDMILNILTGFRLKQNNLNLNVTPHNFCETLQSVLESIKHVFSDNQTTVLLALNTDFLCAEYDDVQIKRVLVNLLTNASKHSKSNSQIAVSAENTMGYLVVCVENFGHIEFENIDDIFKPYKTKDANHPLCGSGLGLYISKQIIEAHGGEIIAKNLSDNRVCIKFKIPVINKQI